jgi:replicative DNA helicase
MSIPIPFAFGASFQDAMLSLMIKDLAFTDKCIQFLEGEYLHSDAHKWFFAVVKEKFDDTGTVPSYVEFEDLLKKEEKHKRRLFKSFAKKIFENPAPSPDFIREKLADFAKRTSFAELFMHGQTLYNSGETDEAYTFVLEAINNLHMISFKDDQMLGIEDFEKHRQLFMAERELFHDKIPTGITPLDQILMGGMSRLEGEFGVILGGPKSGKSIALVHMGFMGLTTLSGNVAHVVLEGSTELTMWRYQSRLSGIPEQRIKTGDLSLEEEKRLEMISARYIGRLELIPFNQHWDYTTSDLEAKIVQLERKGKKPDLLVIDYADLLKARSDYKDQRHEQRDVFRDIKRIAYNKKIATWTGSQAQRPKDDPEKETLLRSRSIAESFEKVRIADFICTLNQTTREEECGIMRLHADIYRANECGQTLYLFTDFARMVLYSKLYGCLQYHELPEWYTKMGKYKK